MENLEIRIQKTTFDVETIMKVQITVMHILQRFGKMQGNHHDCKYEGINKCDADMTTIW